MATVDEIAEVREYIAEPGISNGWTDERITAYIDREPNTLLAASAIWSTKAANYATMVNVSESGSSRSMGSLIDNALKMAAAFKVRGEAESGGTPTEGAVILQRLVRK